MTDDPFPPLDTEDEIAIEAGGPAGFGLGILRRLVWTGGVIALCAAGWFLFAR